MDVSTTSSILMEHGVQNAYLVNKFDLHTASLSTWESEHQARTYGDIVRRLQHQGWMDTVYPYPLIHSLEMNQEFQRYVKDAKINGSCWELKMDPLMDRFIKLGDFNMCFD